MHDSTNMICTESVQVSIVKTMYLLLNCHQPRVCPKVHAHMLLWALYNYLMYMHEQTKVCLGLQLFRICGGVAATFQV